MKKDNEHEKMIGIVTISASQILQISYAIYYSPRTINSTRTKLLVMWTYEVREDDRLVLTLYKDLTI